MQMCTVKPEHLTSIFTVGVTAIYEFVLIKKKEDENQGQIMWYNPKPNHVVQPNRGTTPNPTNKP